MSCAAFLNLPIQEPHQQANSKGKRLFRLSGLANAGFGIPAVPLPACYFFSLQSVPPPHFQPRKHRKWPALSI